MVKLNNSFPVFIIKSLSAAKDFYFENFGFSVVLGIRSEDWGQRHFSVRDPNGIYLDIVQVIKPTKEYQGGYGTE